MTQIRDPEENVDKIREEIDSACKSADRLANATNRFTIALVVVALAALGFEIFKYFDVRSAEQAVTADYRLPVANPPLEPDRPDLIEEPRIEE